MLIRRGPSPAGLFVLFQISSAYAVWPFQQKRFTSEAFIDAGSLGLDAIDEEDGRVVAVGDFNGDQKLDLFTLDQDRKKVSVYTWDHDSFQYKSSRSITTTKEIINIVPSDYDRDGHLDLLLMYEDTHGGWWGPKNERTGMQVYLGDGDGGFREDPWTLPDASEAQPIIFDADGSLRPSLLGWQSSESGSTSSPHTWLNTGTAMTLEGAPLRNPEQACKLADPHSSAFVDINGDCLADLILHCTKGSGDDRYIQIWLNRGVGGFELARSYDLPSGSGPLSFADMNRDGTLDIIFPTCSRLYTSSGICENPSINIAYNHQAPICSGAVSLFKGDEAEGELRCRGWGDLCIPDDNFAFSFTQGDSSFQSVPFSSIWPKDSPDLLYNVLQTVSIPLPIRPGDFNLDGFPDLLLTISNHTASPHGGVFGTSRGNQVRILENVPCSKYKNAAGCAGAGKSGRGFCAGGGKGWEVLDEIWDAQGASWIDIDDDGSLDILVQRSGEQERKRITFIQNNFYHDAFFLKAQVLNGACQGDCEPTAGGRKYSPLGVSYSGASYKFTVLDTLGRRVAQEAAQLPQTGYHTLGTPYSFIGLGRTNNYVERLYVGSSLHPPFHDTYLESIIPNSQIIINPPSPDINSSHPAEPGSAVKYRSTEWKSELYLHPGDWIPWVEAAVVGLVVILGSVVIGLNEKEKREDEAERRRALHAINFQAL